MSTETKEQFTFDSKEWMAVCFDHEGEPLIMGQFDTEDEARAAALKVWKEDQAYYEILIANGLENPRSIAPPIWEVYKRQRTEVGK